MTEIKTLSFLEELKSRHIPPGRNLSPEVEHIVNTCVRAGMGEEDPTWTWFLPLLMRQITSDGIRIEFQTLSKSLKKFNLEEEDPLEDIHYDLQQIRGELNKLPKKTLESLKLDIKQEINESIKASLSSNLASNQNKEVKIEIDDAKVIATMKDAFVTNYVLISIALGLAFSVLSFAVGLNLR
jgi:hypothetical protein